MSEKDDLLKGLRRSDPHPQEEKPTAAAETGPKIEEPKQADVLDALIAKPQDATPDRVAPESHVVPPEAKPEVPAPAQEQRQEQRVERINRAEFMEALNAKRQEPQPPSTLGTGQFSALTQPTGLTPLDLMGLPTEQRKVVNWLSRAKQATFEEMQKKVRIEPTLLKRVLTDLVQSGYLNEALINDEIQYRVVFRGTIRRGPVGLPSEIWSRVDLDHMTFLKQVPLFRGLTDDELHEVANLLGERRYQRDEVIIWQGNVSDSIHLVKSGIVGVARFSAQNKDRKALAYLKQGDLIGEYGVLSEQSGIASATATALSPVDMVYLKRVDFIHLLHKFPSVAIELSRILVQRLIATDSHFNSAMGTRLVMFISASEDSGATMLGNMMAMTLAKMTQKRTVYTEQPEPHRLMPVLHLAPGTTSFSHPGNYEVLLGTASSGLPASVRATLILEEMMNHFDNIVISVPQWADEVINCMIGYANQVILVANPEEESQRKLNKLTNSIKTLIHPEKVGLFYVLNRTKPEHTNLTVQNRVDFDLPFIEGLTPLLDQRPATMPEPFNRFTTSLTDRLGRTNQVSVYIPTTIDVNLAADTMPFVERTLAFLGERFGGATTNQARGVWNSADQGLVGESIHIVRSYATQSALDEHMQEILDFVEGLKKELRQEAMAVEINQKLMLI